VRRFGELRYAARSWQAPRRVIGGVAASPQRSDRRFVVANLAGTRRWLHESVYCQRRQAEHLCADASRSASRSLLRSGMRGRPLLCIRPAEPDALRLS
jgi:hypothetical protein